MSEKKFSFQAENRREQADEKNEISLSHWRGNLHAHTRTDISNPKLPEDIYNHRQGSNCGQVPLQVLVKYFSHEMLNDYTAITEHSRDGNPELAIKGVSKWFLEMYLQNVEWLLKNYRKNREQLTEEEIDEIKKTAEEEAKKVVFYKDERLEQVNSAIDNLDEPIRTIKGVEANLMPNGSFDTDMAEDGKFELVNCSIHPQVDKKNFEKIISDPGRYSDLVVKGIANPATNVMCHIGYGLKKEIIENLNWEKIFSEAVSRQVAVEINLKEIMEFIYDEILDENKFLKDSLYYEKYFKEKMPRLVPILGDKKIAPTLKEYIERGLKLAINTDEHKNPFIKTQTTIDKTDYQFNQRSIRFWRCMRELEKYFNDKFNELGVKKENIINTYSEKDLNNFLNKEE